GRLPPRSHGDAAAAARLDRGWRVLSGAAVQEKWRRALLREPDRGRRDGAARGAQLRRDAGSRRPRGLPRARLALQAHDAIPGADLAAALADARRGGGFLLHVGGLDGRGGPGQHALRALADPGNRLPARTGADLRAA